MDKLERLMSEYPDIDFEFTKRMPLEQGGLTVGNKILINTNISKKEQFQWLLEELGHHETSVGNITNYTSSKNMKQELQARRWGYRHCFSREDFERIRKEHPETDYEVADELGVQVTYLHEIGVTYGLDFKHVKD